MLLIISNVDFGTLYVDFAIRLLSLLIVVIHSVFCSLVDKSLSSGLVMIDSNISLQL